MKKQILTVVLLLLVSGVTFGKSNEKNQLTGKVVELVNGEEQPIALASVLCTGTADATFTDAEGNFSISKESIAKSDVRFSHAGYDVVETKLKKCKDGKCIKIILIKQGSQLAENK
ncbi:MAG: carboxypeptidase-like regulatory domain-containing protein [Bacteroidales bacterium]